jgi:hypothetical protein
MKINLILCYARSGGTIFSKFLKKSSDIVVLSEVHSLNESFNRNSQIVKIQAKQWYNINVLSDDYFEGILEVYEWCKLHNKYLIIREWTYIDFTKNELNKYQPNNFSQFYEFAKKNNISINTIAFVRDTIDVFLSRKSRKVSLTEFNFTYNNYVQYVHNNNIKFFKYEDFCINPMKFYFSLSIFLSLPPYKSLNSKIQNKYITGDINISRGSHLSDVIVLKRRFINPIVLCKLIMDKDIWDCNKIFDYPLTLKDQRSTNFFSYLLHIIVRFFHQIKKKINK